MRKAFANHGVVLYIFRYLFCDNETVQQQVQNATEYIIGRKIARYLTPWVIIPGILGNFLSFIVATRPHNRSLPFGVYMAALACSDTFILAFGQFYGWIMFHFLSTAMNRTECQLLLFVHALGGNVGAWIIVALTFERFLLVYRATDHVRFRTVRTTYIVVAVIITVCFGKNIHYIFTAEFIHDPGYNFMVCAIGFVSSDAQTIFLQVFELCFSSVIPFIFIVTLNGFIIYRLQQQATIRKKRFGRHSAYGSTVSIASKTPRDSAKGLTLMLLAVSLAFACLTSPLFVFRFRFAFKPNVCNEPDTMARYVLEDNILGLLYASNFSINFILYCLTGTLFREDLTNIFKKLSGRIDITIYIKHVFHKTYDINLKTNVQKNDNTPIITSFKSISELNVADLIK